MSETENDVLKRQIRYLSELISSSSESSSVPLPSSRPLTYSQISTQHRHDKQKKSQLLQQVSTDKSKFSWKKQSKTDTGHQRTRAENHYKKTNYVKNLSTENLSNTYIQHPPIDATKTLSKKAVDTAIKEIDLIKGFQKEALSSKSTATKLNKNETKNYPIVSSSRSVSSGILKPHESKSKTVENFCCDESKKSTSATLLISKRLRNHPFMNKSKNIVIQSDESKEENNLPNQEDSGKKNRQNEGLNTKKHSQIASKSLPSKQDLFKPEKNSSKAPSTNTEKKLSEESVKLSYQQLGKETGRSETKLTSKKNVSPKKVEMIKELNQKLYATSNKIKELQKTLLLKTSQPNKNVSESIGLKQVASQSSSLNHAKESKLLVSAPLKFTLGQAHPGHTNATGRQISSCNSLPLAAEKLTAEKYIKNSKDNRTNTQSLSKETDQYVVKGKYSLRKVAKEECSTTIMTIDSKPFITEHEVITRKSNLSSESEKTEVNVSDKYQTRKSSSKPINHKDSRFVKNSTGDMTSVELSMNLISERTTILKSKYSLKKIPIASDIGNIDQDRNLNFRKNSKNTDPRRKHVSRYKLQRVCKPEVPQQLNPLEDSSFNPKQTVIKSKYKLQKVQNEYSTSTPLVRPKSSSVLTSNIIKSKYKLIKASHQFGLSSKCKSPATKTIKSKYSLRKIPVNSMNSSIGTSSSYYSSRNQKYLFKSSANPKNLSHHSKSSENSRQKRQYPRSIFRQNRYWRYGPSKMTENEWLQYRIKKMEKLVYGKVDQSSLENRKSFPRSSGYISSFNRFLGQYRSTYSGRNVGAFKINRRYVLNHLHTARTVQSSDKKNESLQSKRQQNTKLVVINGMLYRSSGHSLVKTKQNIPNQVVVRKMNATSMKIVKVRGVKFQMDSSGKTLKRMDSSPVKSALAKNVRSSIQRVDIGGMTYRQTRPGTLEQTGSSQTKYIANRMKNRSIQTAAARYKKDNTKKKVAKKYCVFYNRFGKCQRGDKCPYEHDPERVAVCTRFLRGTCKVDDCPFSHKVSKEKMPTCSYFLRGVCNREDCPYLHVNVSKTAKVCAEFVKGYCPLGEKCKKKHTLNCPSFSKTGVCTEDKPCRLKHVRRKQRYTAVDLQTSSDGKPDDKPELKRKHEESEDDSGIPFKQRKLPTFISIMSNSGEETKETENLNASKSVMKIRPQLVDK